MRRVASSGGVLLAVHHLGGSDDRPVVLLAHATGFHGLVWAPLAAHLTDRYRVLSLDFRAHGASTRPDDGDLRWEGFGDDVLAVLDALAPREEPVAVGHSMGGAALLLAEAARPGTFAALACWEPIVFPPDAPAERENPLAAGALRRRDVFPSKEAAYANFAAKPPLDALAEPALCAYVDHGFEDLADGTVRLRCRPEDESAVYRGGGAHRGWRALPEVTCPVTLLAGEHSPATGPPLVAQQVARLPAGTVRVVSGRGHFGPLEDPSGVAEELLAALPGSS